MGVHLTSPTLILVITMSGQDGVSGIRQGLHFFFYLLQVGDYADVDNWPALEKTLLIQYFVICSLLYSLPNNKMKSCFLVGLVCHGGQRGSCGGG